MGISQVTKQFTQVLKGEDFMVRYGSNELIHVILIHTQFCNYCCPFVYILEKKQNLHKILAEAMGKKSELFAVRHCQ